MAQQNVHPSDSFGPFAANVPESERFPQPMPDHQAVERKRSGGLDDSPADMPVRPVGPAPYSPTRLR